MCQTLSHIYAFKTSKVSLLRLSGSSAKNNKRPWIDPGLFFSPDELTLINAPWIEV